MSHIRGKDTTIETEVRRYLFSKGFRFRKNDKRYPGHPDIVLPKYKTVIFVNGCFWHRHPGCKYAYTPKSNIEFWEKKFEKNVSNDKRDKELLENMGWHVIIVWECELKTEERRKQRLERLEAEIRSQQVNTESNKNKGG